MKTDTTQGTTPENITRANTEGRRNVKSILWNKFLDILENSTFRQIILTTLLVLVSLVLTFVLTYTKETVAAIVWISKMNNYVIPKMIFSFIVVFNFTKLIQFARELIPEPAEEPTGDTIEGIPVVELLDHLFEFESFKRDDVEKKFGIPRNRFTDLANKLEELGVLKRGENNARILNDEFARIDVAAILQGKMSAEELRRVHRKIDDHTWTSQPSKSEIVQNVEKHFEEKKEEDESPSPAFKRRKIHSDE